MKGGGGYQIGPKWPSFCVRLGISDFQLMEKMLRKVLALHDPNAVP
jgi:hypothetical protein